MRRDRSHRRRDRTLPNRDPALTEQAQYVNYSRRDFSIKLRRKDEAIAGFGNSIAEDRAWQTRENLIRLPKVLSTRSGPSRQGTRSLRPRRRKGPSVPNGLGSLNLSRAEEVHDALSQLDSRKTDAEFHRKKREQLLLARSGSTRAAAHRRANQDRTRRKRQPTRRRIVSSARVDAPTPVRKPDKRCRDSNQGWPEHASDIAPMRAAGGCTVNLPLDDPGGPDTVYRSLGRKSTCDSAELFENASRRCTWNRGQSRRVRSLRRELIQGGSRNPESYLSYAGQCSVSDAMTRAIEFGLRRAGAGGAAVTRRTAGSPRRRDTRVPHR